MAVDLQQQKHRSTLKQQNKSHKHGRHRTKGQLDRETKGRADVKLLSKKSKKELKRLERRHQASQVRKLKREEAVAKKRNRGGSASPPHFVVVVPLHKEVDTTSVIQTLIACDESNKVIENEQGIFHISVPRFKQRISMFVAQKGNLYALLDAAKVADSLLCVLSPDEGIDEFGDHCLKCLSSQGLPAMNFIAKGLNSCSQKKQNEAKRKLQKTVETRFPSEKFHTLDTDQDGLLVLRQITERKLKPVYYRDLRPHMVAENIEFELANEESEHGVLKVSGFLRGKSLNVNSLVHLPGWGDFQMLQIDSVEDPYPLMLKNDKNRKNSKQLQDVDMADISGSKDDLVKVLEKADPSKQESLQSEVIPDPMEGEQTWPTEEELAEAEAEAKKKMKKVPKGTSEYQASWIVDSDEEGGSQEDSDSDSDDDDLEDDEMSVRDDEDSDEAEIAGDKEEYETITVTDNLDTAKYDEEMDIDEDRRIMEKIKEERTHVMFPDEVDTPMNTQAKVRFQKYRGLKSFRTSLWDPKENLPSDYARIFQFENFRRTKKRVLSDDDDNGALAGWYITVHIANVPKEFMETYQPGMPVVIFGLLQHEQKMSVINFLLKRCPEVNKPIKSKERLIFHVGFRRYSACPIFSQHTNASKHKFERYFPHNASVIATVFAPVTFPPCPVLAYKETYAGQHELVATGLLHSVNPDRMVIKRLVLSGHPFKINKRSAVVRFMFFNREDIMWFKPVELKTKWGRRGHIKEPLGTHGHMKCIFDGQLKSQDTVLLNLYKRMYPKWTYNSYIRSPPVINEYACSTMDTEDEQISEEAYKLFD